MNIYDNLNDITARMEQVNIGLAGLQRSKSDGKEYIETVVDQIRYEICLAIEKAYLYPDEYKQLLQDINVRYRYIINEYGLSRMDIIKYMPFPKK